MSAIDDLFKRVHDREIDGGCDDCNAFQRLTQTDGIWHLVVHHDETCPWFLAQKGAN